MNDESEEQKGLPATIRDNDESIDFKKAFTISAILHPLSLGLVWLLMFILALLGINFALFERPKPKMNDIEFVLVDKEGTPRDKNTKNRAHINSRSGGVNDPKRKVSMPSPTPKKAVKPAAGGAPKKTVTQQPKKVVQQPQQAQTKATTKPEPPQRATTPTAPKAPSVSPSVKAPSAPKVTVKPTSPFTVPVPNNLPTGKSLSTGPVGGEKVGAKIGGGYAPTPSFSPTTGSGGKSQLGAGNNSGYSAGSTGNAGTGNVGNPGGGGGAPGIDAIREPDFGPYMRELQRRIKMNWDPPKGNESKRVVLLFKIAKDGRLLSCRVLKTSGLPSADKAAINAVELTAPFRPLPVDFKGQSVDIQFTFDYNVFGASRY